MLQVFNLDVAKVDLDVAYVAMAIHTCHCIFQVICMQSYVASVSIGCLKSRYGRAHVGMAVVLGGQRPATAACYCYWGAVAGHRVTLEAGRRLRGTHP